MNPHKQRLLNFLYGVELRTIEDQFEQLEEERQQREDAYWSRVAAGVPHPPSEQQDHEVYERRVLALNRRIVDLRQEVSNLPTD